MIRNKKREEIETRIEKAERFYPDFVSGLSTIQVIERVEQKLYNKTPKKVTKTYWRILCDNLFSFFNLIFLAITLMMIAAQKDITFFFFTLPIICNIVIGLATDIRARKLVDKLRVLTDPKITVVRDGKKQEISTKEIVLDDIVYLKAGDQVPADGMVIEGQATVDESLLTGEPEPIHKTNGITVYSGSFLTAGQLYMRVEKIGLASYAETLQDEAKRFERPKSDLKRSTLKIFFVTGLIAVVMGIAMLLQWLISGLVNGTLTYASYQDFVEGFSGSLVAMIPAGLYLLTSLTLGIGVLYLAKKRMNVQELYCIEMLARVDVICFDKTGTLTDGNLEVNQIINYSKIDAKTLQNYLYSLVLGLGDHNQTAEAILNYGGQQVITPRVKFPFDSAKKLSAATFKGIGTLILGAPEFINARLTEEQQNELKSLIAKGVRVLGFYLDKHEIEEYESFKAPKLLGFIVLSDHIKADAKANIEWFQKNKVITKIISGDNPQTVSYIAQQAGVIGAEHYISMVDVKDEEIPDIVNKYAVFGRVKPQQKALIIEALQNEGHKVAMTGDGVNDIIALKKADCSIAMGSGSSAARNVSHIVSLDNDFSKLPLVVGEGRRVINNLQRAASLFLAKNIFAIILSVVFFIASLCGGSTYPFSTKNMIIWEMVTIGLGGFLLALQPSKEPLKGSFMSNVIEKALPSGLVSVIAVTIVYILALVAPNFINSEQAVTVSVIVFSLMSFYTFIRVSYPFDRYRAIVLICLIVISLFLLMSDLLFPIDLFGIDLKGLRLQLYGFACLMLAISIGVYAGLNALTIYIGKKVREKYANK